MNPSLEQQQILDSLINNNVVVNSVAGSGKTTTNIFIAKMYSNQKILLLTYNTKLSIETKERLLKNNVTNMEVYTYHAFCVNHYIPQCKNDQELEHLINNKIKPIKIIDFDIIILDESQDITILLYELVCKITKDNIKNAKICILGDENQSIYGYNGADSRYITHAKDIYKFNDLNWVELKLSESYRITEQMSNFINKCCLGYDRIIAKKQGIKPIYIHKDIFYITNPKYNNEHSLINVILKLLKENNYTYDDVFILAPSIKSSNNYSPIKLLANSFTDRLIPIFIPISDDQKIDKTQIENKVLFSSFHQAKGLERKIVIVFEFTQDYFLYYAKDDNPDFFTNPLYVATTRASEILILLHDYKKPFLNFIDKDLLLQYVEYDDYDMKKKPSINNNKKSTVGVTTFIRNMSYDFYKVIMEYVNVKEISKKCNKNEIIKICPSVKQLVTTENVSEINGDCVHLYFEYKSKGSISVGNSELFEYVNKQKLKRKKSCKTFGKCKLDSYDLEQVLFSGKCWANMLAYAVNHHNSNKNNLDFKVHQITKYKWLSNELLNMCLKRISKFISKESVHEIMYDEDMSSKSVLRGFIDIIDKTNINEYVVWEIKAVNELTFIHYLQIIIYMCMVEKKKRKTLSSSCYKYRLFNVLDNHILEFSANLNDIDTIFNLFLNYTQKIQAIGKFNFEDRVKKVYEKYYC